MWNFLASEPNVSFQSQSYLTSSILNTGPFPLSFLSSLLLGTYVLIWSLSSFYPLDCTTLFSHTCFLFHMTTGGTPVADHSYSRWLQFPGQLCWWRPSGMKFSLWFFQKMVSIPSNNCWDNDILKSVFEKIPFLSGWAWRLEKNCHVGKSSSFAGFHTHHLSLLRSPVFFDLPPLFTMPT